MMGEPVSLPNEMRRLHIPVGPQYADDGWHTLRVCYKVFDSGPLHRGPLN